MKRFLQAAASLLLGRERRDKKRKRIDKEQPEIALNLNSSHQNDLTVDKTQLQKEGKLKDKGVLFVGGLHYGTTSTELSVYFSKFGDVINSVVIKCPTTGKSRGYGFVSFLNPADAEKALQTKEHTLHDRTLVCRPYDSKDDSKVSKAKKTEEGRIFLGGLPANVTNEELQQFFSRYGKVTKVHVPVDRNTKEAKGYGFISFENEDAAEKCIAERFVHLKERRVYMNKAAPRDARLRAEDEISSSKVTDQDSFSPEDSASLQTDEDTLSSSSGQFSFELEQHPEFQRLFQNYFVEKFNYFNGMSGKEFENTKEQLQNNEIEDLETFLRGLSVNYRDFHKDSDSEIAESYTSGDSYEKDCENDVSHRLLREDFGDCASKKSVGKNASKVTPHFEKDRPDLKFTTQELTEDSLNKSSAAVSFKNSTDGLTCYLCGWTSPDCGTFLAHCKTLAHKMKLMERFSESEAPKGEIDPKSYANSKKQKDSLPEVISYPKVTDTHLDGSQRQSNDQKCGKMQQTHQDLKQPREEPLRHQLVNQKVENVEKVQRKKKQKQMNKEEEEEKVLNSVEESKVGVRNSENERQTCQSDKQNSHQKTKDKKMKKPNLMIYALSKGMACIQPLSENKLKCGMCNKIIPESSDIGVLMMNVSHHLQSKKHLQKLLETEEKLKSLDSKNEKPGETGILDKKNSKEESLKEKNIPSKKKSPKNQGSLSHNKASLVEKKTVLESNKTNPKDLSNNPKNAAPKQEKGKTDGSRKKILCLQCNFSSTFEEFGRHLKSKRHSSTSTSNAPLTPQNIEHTQCNFCDEYLFGSLYEINVHFSAHFS